MQKERLQGTLPSLVKYVKLEIWRLFTLHNLLQKLSKYLVFISKICLSFQGTKNKFNVESLTNTSMEQDYLYHNTKQTITYICASNSNTLLFKTCLVPRIYSNLCDKQKNCVECYMYTTIWMFIYVYMYSVCVWICFSYSSLYFVSSCPT